ncbi:MAG: substrate-binding domain-containing protein [Thiotrichales bacterium]
MEHRILKRGVILAVLLAGFGSVATAVESITLASTTSTDNSGLFGHMLPLFEQASGIKVKVVALGTGQALDVGKRGDADVLLVHDRAKEDAFVAEGYGAYRKDVMFNDFVMIGPQPDPAGVRQADSTTAAFRQIADQASAFVSRGDNSGTHAAELRFWREAGVEPKGTGWYKEAGAGMGPTLNIAAGMGAYTLADRGTWASFKNRQDLVIVLEGDERLYNPYGVLLVNPAKHPHVKQLAVEKFISWITSEAGRKAIAGFKLKGEQLFFPLPAQ